MIAVDSAVLVGFFIAAAVAITLTPWMLVAIYLAHGGKDLWQHRHQFVRGTRWWPPFYFAADVVVAVIVTHHTAAPDPRRTPTPSAPTPAAPSSQRMLVERT